MIHTDTGNIIWSDLRDGTHHGKIIRWKIDGSLSYIESWQNGRLHGKTIKWHPRVNYKLERIYVCFRETPWDSYYME